MNIIDCSARPHVKMTDDDIRGQLWQELSPVYSRQAKESHAKIKFKTTSQDILSILAGPVVGHQSFLITGQPGSGKTKATLGSINTIIQSISSKRETDNPPVAILSYNRAVFEQELMQNHEYGITSEFEALDKILGGAVEKNDADVRSALLDYYRIYGYKKFESMIFPGTPEEKEPIFRGNYAYWTDELQRHVDEGRLKVNHEFVKSLEGTILIADEIHVAHSSGNLNRSGLGIEYVKRCLKNFTFIMLDATPISRTSIEIISIINLMFTSNYEITDYFEKRENNWRAKPQLNDILKEVGQKTYVLSQPAMSSCPSVIIEGEQVMLKKKKLMHNYTLCNLKKKQKDIIRNYAKDHADVKVAETCALTHNGIVVKGEAASTYIIEKELSNRQDCEDASAKLEKLGELLFKDGLIWKPGNIIIYSPLMVHPGSSLILHYFRHLGLKKYNDKRARSEWCIICKGRHISTGSHIQVPPMVGELNRRLQISEYVDMFNKFNSYGNQDGHIAKILVATRCIDVSVTLQNSNVMIFYDLPPSVPNEIQVEGRIARPFSITNIAIGQVVHVYRLLAWIDENTPTTEVLHELAKEELWSGVKKIIEVIISYSCTLPYVDPRAVITKYIDSPAYTSRRTFNTANEITHYRKYRMNPLNIATPIKNMQLSAKRGWLIPVMIKRVTIAMAYIKHMVVIYPVISLDQLMNKSRSAKAFITFNVSSLTSEDFVIAGELLTAAGEHIVSKDFEEKVRGIATQEQYQYIIFMLAFSVASPWIINANRALARIVFFNNIFYQVSGNMVNIHPVYRQFVEAEDVITGMSMPIPAITKHSNIYINNIIAALKSLKPDDPILLIFSIVKLDDIEILMYNIVAGNVPDAPRITELIGLFVAIRVLIPRTIVERITGEKHTQEYPILYIRHHWYLYDDGLLSRIHPIMNEHVKFANTGELQLRLNRANNKVSIILYNNAKTDDVKITDNRRVQKGINIMTATIANIRHRLEIAKSDMSLSLIEQSQIITDPIEYRKKIIDIIVKAQMADIDTQFILIKW